MKEGWEIKKLGEVCEVQRGLTYSRKDTVDFSNNIVLRATNIKLENSSLDFTELKYLRDDFQIKENYKLRKGSLLICFSSGSKSHLGKVALVDKDYDFAFGGFIGQINPNKEISSKYLFYNLISGTYKNYISELTDGININNLKSKDLQAFQIPIPPLPEQKRIVSILDHAFAAIDKAIANTEKNLQNARELFDSYLNGIFSNPGDDWDERKLGECFKLKSGDGLTQKNMIPGNYKVFGGNGVAGLHNKYNLCGENLIVGRVGALCGNVRYIKENIWLTDNAFKIINYKSEFDFSFLEYLLNFLNLRIYARQAAQPVISNSSLKDVVLNFPKSINEQKQIVSKLDSLSKETKRLESIYNKKLENLKELKQSILQKVFEGEL